MTSGVTPGGAGRFPGFDVVSMSPTWDRVTVGVVLGRLGPPPVPVFFTVEEEATARPLLDRLLGQDDEPRVPVFELIDARLAERETDGWHYEELPPDGDAWKRSLHALAESAGEAGFAGLGRPAQVEVLEAVRVAERWHGFPAGRLWSLWMRYALAAFYSHPWAWNEIGFGGPRYPTGYKNLGIDRREPWEVMESGAADPESWARRLEKARVRHTGASTAPGADHHAGPR